MRKPWPDSLFTRLLLAQGLVLAGAVLIFGIMSIIERNSMLALHYCTIWEPTIRQVMAAPVGSPAVPVYDLPGGLRHEAGAPAWRFPAFPVTRNAVRQAMEPRGIQVDGVWLTVGSRGSTVWLALRLDGGPVAWVSLNGYRWLPGWSPRMALGLVLTLVLMAAVSRYFVRRVTRPLAALHTRMLHHAATGQVLAQAPAGPPPAAPPELQAMDQAYSQLAEKLARNERERALLLAGVSHDLRSPLARIRLAAEMLPETADNVDGVNAVTRNVDVADRLIASFLEFVRAGTQKLDETVDAAAVVRQAVSAIGRPPGELVARLPERLLLRQASALLLERLVVNLVDNALKHGGPPVQVHLSRVDDMMQLDVVDGGPGLPAGAGDTLLEAFARGDASRGVPGFGLGLAIVHQIVTRLHGRLHFEHRPIGHTVQVIIPLSR
jgi:two-component system osmolarity sensor histidine kinase EnvZ